MGESFMVFITGECSEKPMSIDFHIPKWASRLLYIATLLAGSCLRGNAIEAEDIFYYRIGNVSLRPSFSISQSYNDNIFFRSDESVYVIARPVEIFGTEFLQQGFVSESELQEGDIVIDRFDRVGDLITTMNAATSILFGNVRGNYILNNYQYSHRLFQEYSLQNAGVHNFTIQGKWDGVKMDLTPSFSYANTQSILSGSFRREGELANLLIERNIISASPQVRLRLTPKAFSTTTLQYNFSDFVDDTLPFFDTDHIGLRQGFGFQLSPKISLSAYGSYGRRTVSPNDDRPAGSAQTYIGGGFSASGNFTRRLRGTIRFGIQEATFSTTSESLVAPTAGITLSYLMGRDLAANLSYTRATFIGIQFANQTGISDRVSLDLQKPFGTRKNWLVKMSGNFNFQSWESEIEFNQDRSDTWFSTNFSIQYRIQQWLSSSISYSFQSFSSNKSGLGFGLLDYDVNTIHLSLRVGY